jgi:hypothetical protein
MNSDRAMPIEESHSIVPEPEKNEFESSVTENNSEIIGFLDFVDNSLDNSMKSEIEIMDSSLPPHEGENEEQRGKYQSIDNEYQENKKKLLQVRDFFRSKTKVVKIDDNFCYVPDSDDNEDEGSFVTRVELLRAPLKENGEQSLNKIAELNIEEITERNEEQFFTCHFKGEENPFIIAYEINPMEVTNKQKNNGNRDKSALVKSINAMRIKNGESEWKAIFPNKINNSDETLQPETPRKIVIDASIHIR